MEALNPWLPLSGMEEELFLETAFYGVNGEFIVTLSQGIDATRHLEVFFSNAVCFRMNPEHFYLQKSWWGTLTVGSIFEVVNSDYVTEVLTKTQSIHGNNCFHYACITVDGCIDVLSYEKPVAKWVNLTHHSSGTGESFL